MKISKPTTTGENKIKPKVIFKCKCGNIQVPDAKNSNKNWNYYSNEECGKCGGVFKLQVIY